MNFRLRVVLAALLLVSSSAAASASVLTPTDESRVLMSDAAAAPPTPLDPLADQTPPHDKADKSAGKMPFFTSPAAQVTAEAMTEGGDTAIITAVAPPTGLASTPAPASAPAAPVEDAGTVAPFVGETAQAPPAAAVMPSSSSGTSSGSGSGAASTSNSTTSTTTIATSKSASGSGGNRTYACTCKDLYRVSLMGYADYCLPGDVDIGKKCGNRNEMERGQCPKKGAIPCSSTGYKLTQDAECLLDGAVYKCVLSADDYDIKKNGGKPKKTKKNTTTVSNDAATTSQDTSAKSDAITARQHPAASALHVITLVAAVVLGVVALL